MDGQLRPNQQVRIRRHRELLEVGFAEPSLLADAARVASYVAAASWLATVTGLERIGMLRVPLEEGDLPTEAQDIEGPLWNAGRVAWVGLLERLTEAVERPEHQHRE